MAFPLTLVHYGWPMAGELAGVQSREEEEPWEVYNDVQKILRKKERKFLKSLNLTEVPTDEWFTKRQAILSGQSGEDAKTMLETLKYCETWMDKRAKLIKALQDYRECIESRPHQPAAPPSSQHPPVKALQNAVDDLSTQLNRMSI